MNQGLVLLGAESPEREPGVLRLTCRHGDLETHDPSVRRSLAT